MARRVVKRVLRGQVKSCDARSSLETPGQVLGRQVRSWGRFEYRNAQLTVYAGCDPTQKGIE